MMELIMKYKHFTWKRLWPNLGTLPDWSLQQKSCHDIQDSNPLSSEYEDTPYLYANPPLLLRV